MNNILYLLVLDSRFITSFYFSITISHLFFPTAKKWHFQISVTKLEQLAMIVKFKVNISI